VITHRQKYIGRRRTRRRRIERTSKPIAGQIRGLLADHHPFDLLDRKAVTTLADSGAPESRRRWSKRCRWRPWPDLYHPDIRWN
jgi:hypothetical protein